MKIGINLLLWTPFVEEEHFGILEKLKATGYDGVEVPLFGGDVEHYKKVAGAIRDHGLACTTCTVMPDEEHNPISSEPKHRDGAVDYLKWVLDCCEALGAEVLCGPFYQPLGKFSGVPPTADEKQRAVDVHRQVAEYAKARNVELAVECLNRFECYFLNTLADGAAHARQVNHPSFGVMYDAFHANIEEKDPVGCISENIDAIKHVHVSENDRGTPGKGHVPFDEIFKTLRAGGYDNWLTIEAFGRSLPELAATTCVWRDLSASPEECYGDGYRMIKQTWEAAA
jgi:D-psicose/D-tagatose/L-ribulose 3-epimerase